ncbi:hypothetical protein ACFYS8_02295 [Kitasatospora sp. NPDC004615]|uniref:hypothetical protein n=1 Tax=Kitasatospora sp. NPDC004615 TaxID=3364017 RepID=UPI003673E178
MTYPNSRPRLTISIYKLNPDGTRTLRSVTSSDEPVAPPRSALTWPACACPRCDRSTA